MNRWATISRPSGTLGTVFNLGTHDESLGYSAGGKQTSVWDRIRAMPYAEKIILAAKADRS